MSESGEPGQGRRETGQLGDDGQRSDRPRRHRHRQTLLGCPDKFRAFPMPQSHKSPLFAAGTNHNREHEATRVFPVRANRLAEPNREQSYTTPIEPQIT